MERASKILRERAKSDLYFLGKEILGYSLLGDYHKNELCPWVEQNRDKDFLHLGFRGSYKTTVITVVASIQEILRNPNIRILLLQSTEDNAQAHIGVIKRHFLYNKRLRALFPELCPSISGNDKVKRWGTSLEFTVNRNAYWLAEPTMTGGGVNTHLVSRHYDLIVYDDIVDEKTVTNRELIRKAIDQYRLSVSMLMPGGRKRVVGTRYDYEDVYSFLLNQPGYVYFTKPALDKEGKPTVPEILNEEQLDALKNLQGNYIFSCQYLLEPVSQEEAPFREEWYVEFKELPKEIDVVLGIDPAFSKSKGADETAMVATAFDRENNAYVVDRVRGHFSLEEMYERCIAMHTGWNFKEIFLETNAYQKGIREYFMHRATEEGINLPLCPLPHWTNKFMRIVSYIQPRLQATVSNSQKYHKLYFSPSLTDFKIALKQFPRGKDDLLDALTNTLEGWRRGNRGDREYETVPGTFADIRRRGRLYAENEQREGWERL